ncbi:Mediator of RNA polymerase II transcription subunit 10 [Ophiocordyceps camponoti-floridani]|uniref:Mediator of RNA polymerase II transcription subunit 10 n=1 Tax=Ophiocordyceps camponoti-floridani TaxID=2030778 RepID=A0A8H4VAR1_9HYPO|nr:Mediator of RNA polymerase II transcription subunit 10 [Ophiocordyceps camponoti-floridani]
MPPLEQTAHEDLEQQLKDIIQDLYQPRSPLQRNQNPINLPPNPPRLRLLPPTPLPSVPPELLEYVENGRNPDIYTREFIELVRRGNQLMRGKMLAFAGFRDVLAAEMLAALPELSDDVDRVLDATGGKGNVVAG